MAKEAKETKGLFIIRLSGYNRDLVSLGGIYGQDRHIKDRKVGGRKVGLQT